MKAILIPGNGGCTPESVWLPYAKRELTKIGIETVNVQFPDSDIARAEYWLPFIKELGADENTILIGHSSGALAAMRFAETNKILGSVLAGTAHTDLGDEKEKASHYFDTPWNWKQIKENQKWIIEFHSIDDPFIPVKEARFVHEQLGTEYHEFTDRGHFMDNEFPELIETIKEVLK